MNEFTWTHRTGKNQEGHRFSTEVMIDGSGRIAAKVLCPAAQDEYAHTVIFYITEDLDKMTYQFLEPEPAKRFAERTAGHLWRQFTEKYKPG